MKQFIAITLCLFFICGTMFCFICLPRNVSEITAEGGVLDLTVTAGSSAPDFTDTIFTLNGEWEFYYGELYTPDDFTDELPVAAFIKTPTSWHKSGYPLHGYATYRLTVLTDEPEFYMMIPEITDSSVVWINGQKVSEIGTPGRTREETAPALRSRLVICHPENGQMEIIVQAANYGWTDSGLRYGFVLGRGDFFLADVFTRRIMLAFVMGAMLAMSFYHALLFVYRRKEPVYLVFSFLCLVMTTRFCVDPNGFAKLVLPGGVAGEWLRVYPAAMILITVALVLFTHIIFSIPLKDVIQIAVYGACFLIPAAMIFFVPYGYINVQIVFLVLLPLLLALISAVKLKRIRENPYNNLFLLAMTFHIIWFPIVRIFFSSLYMQAVVNNLFLVLSQCVMLSVSYAETKRREETLTEHNRLLDRLNHTKTEFLQDMSHEMKAPLTVIAAGVDFANREINKESGSLADAGAALNNIQDETQRLGRMVGSMVTLASMSEAGANRERVDFAALLRGSAEAFRVMLEQNGNRLRVGIAPGLPDVFVENDRYVQVMANLLSNAVNHMQNGQIDLTAEFDSAFITVRVADDGKGIAPGLLPHVFGRGVSGRIDGTGYGLAICKTVVEAHGGTIEIESEPGRGTVVVFTVPVYGGQEAGHKL